jgi:acyl-CoA thioesterase-1
MNRSRLILLVIVVLGVLGFAWKLTRHVSYRNFPPTHGTTWVAFGDSITAGSGATSGHDYPTLLGARLGVPIMNAGVPGMTTAEGLDRVAEVFALDPKIVLLCLGGNDGLQQLPINDTVNNLSAIVARLQEHGAFVVLIGVRSASLIDKYHKPFKQLAGEKQTLFISDILDDVLGKPRLMADQIHPNDAGNEIIAARLEKELRRAGVDKLSH